jgi:16S rRNA (cytosine967-C5)-methyltransferase
MQQSSLLGHVQELLALIVHAHHHRRAGGRVQPADAVIDAFFRARKYLGSHDRRFIAETTYGTLRHLRRCEYVVLASVPRPSIPRGDRLLLLALAYLLHIERQPLTEISGLSDRITARDLRQQLPEILARFSSFMLPVIDEPVERLGLQYSFPDWMVRRFLEEFGAGETERLLAHLNQPAPLQLRVNTLKATVEECQQRLAAEGLETKRTTHSPIGLEVSKRINVFQHASFREGLFEVQDEGSQLLPLLIDPKPGEKVLDACAGAGGKTLELAALMNNRGEIVATDVQAFRLQELKKRAQRAGVSNVRIRWIDDLADLAKDFANSFSLVLVDAPCSGLGTLRRNPGMKWTVTEATGKELSAIQTELLERSAPLVRQGGRLVYATCTLLREENEDVVERFLSRHPEFSLLDPAGAAAKFHLSHAVSGTFIKLLPHLHGTDGFFCALLHKVSSK